MHKKLLASLFVAGSLMFASSASAAHHTDHAMAKPPAKFVKVSDALKLKAMEFIPGLGTLYVDPATLPAGPFLGYDKAGKLMNVTYMIPLKDIQAKTDFKNLGTAVIGLKVDHTSIEYSDAHPGVAEPHVHFINWLVPAAEHKKALGEYQHSH